MHFTYPQVLNVTGVCVYVHIYVCMMTLPDVAWFPPALPLIGGSSEALHTSDVKATLSRCSPPL